MRPASVHARRSRKRSPRASKPRLRDTAGCSASSSRRAIQPRRSPICGPRAGRARWGVTTSRARWELPDLLEALVAMGELDEAEAIAAAAEERARSLDRAWALALSARTRAVVAAVRGNLDGAFAAFEEALAEHARTRDPFQHARTLLALGTSSGGQSGAATRGRPWNRRSRASSSSGPRSGLRRHGPSWRGSADGRPRGAHRERAPHRRARRRGAHEPRGRRGALRHRAHGRDRAHAHIPKIGRPLAGRTGEPAAPRQTGLEASKHLRFSAFAAARRVGRSSRHRERERRS